MPYPYKTDAEMEEATTKVMRWGTVLLAAMVLAFPLYRWVEPGNREAARAQQLTSLEESGSQLFQQNCSSCHGLNGEGGVGPALNSKQFLSSATDQQIRSIIAVGVPGTAMSAWSQDHGGPLTSEQIKALSTFLRGWEKDAPDRPDWRTPQA